MMRISSSATNSTKGVLLCSAVLEKLARKSDLILTYCGEKHYLEYYIKPSFVWIERWILVCQIRVLVGSVSIYNLCLSFSNFYDVLSETAGGPGPILVIGTVH